MNTLGACLYQELQETTILPLTGLLGAQATKPADQALYLAIPELSEILTSPIRTEESAGIADSILKLRWGQELPHPQWWQTALGATVGFHATDQAISQTQAALILDVQRGTISKLISRGTLQTIGKNPTKVSRREILSRLNQRKARQ